MFRFPWQRHRELEARVLSAREEAEKSRRELERTREEIIRPLIAAGNRNHFADMIRASLFDGKGH
jgi:hypothetical protein